MENALRGVTSHSPTQLQWRVGMGRALKAGAGSHSQKNYRSVNSIPAGYQLQTSGKPLASQSLQIPHL